MYNCFYNKYFFIQKVLFCFLKLTVTKCKKTFREITNRVIFCRHKRIDNAVSQTTLYNEIKLNISFRSYYFNVSTFSLLEHPEDFIRTSGVSGTWCKSLDNQILCFCVVTYECESCLTSPIDIYRGPRFFVTQVIILCQSYTITQEISVFRSFHFIKVVIIKFECIL